MTSRVSLLSVVFTLPLLAAEPDWPQFRGPKRDDNSPDKGLLKSWPADGPTVAWKAEGVGDGFSSVSIVGDKVLTMGDSGDSSHVFAVSRKDGSKLWEARVGKSGGGGGHPGPRCTPTVDGGRVFALGQYGDLVCLNLADGKEHWRASLAKDFHGHGGGWGYTESPLVDGDKVIVTPGGREATMIALDRKTGEPVWKGQSPNGESAGYSSPVVSTAGGTRQYVTLTSKGVVSFSADSGKLLWSYGTVRDRLADNTANIPTVVLLDDPNRIFTAAGYGRGGGLVELRSEGGTIDTHEVYWNGELTNKHGGVVRVGDYLYGDRDDSGHLWCAEAKTGKVVWTRKDRSEGGGSAALTYADGMLYVRYQNGWVSLVAADPKEYREVSNFRVPNGRSNCWAHPVVVGGKLYVREKDVIWCYDVSAK
jgi:outer membrane protein assembly factor BamB